jgi:DNA-binding transcriptional MerR regulator/predicted transcriptional regulator YdeE
MFAIGEFARHGRVSVRMLRHYDAVGLLEPAFTDPATGYRYYEAGQLSRLNRIIALKDLGFTLPQVASLLDEEVGAAELRGMLMLRRAELRDQIAADRARLARVEGRLLTIECEDSGTAVDVVRKCIAPVRVAELTATAASYEPASITPVIQPLYRDLFAVLCRSGATAPGPAIAYYTDADADADATATADAGAITVHAAVAITAQAACSHELSVVDLPEIATAATLIHRGSMDQVLPSVQALARWIDASGYRSLGYPRELTLKHAADRDEWVTELQQPVISATDSQSSQPGTIADHP